MATVRYIVDDVDEGIRFYIEHFGFSVKEKWGDAFAILSHEDLDLWLSGPGTSARRPMEDGEAPAPGGWNRIVVQVPSLDSVAEALRLAGNLRNPPVAGPGGRQALAMDPSGNFVELFEAKA